jgi:basic amino acid/polyamine antiporter, APA family
VSRGARIVNWRIRSVEGCLSAALQSPLRRSLGPIQLAMLGIGAIVGTGIFVLTAIGAERAGPALMLSFLIAAAVCGLAALAYAELAAMIPVAGSAYTYSYAVLGELPAWLVGWNLILEYAAAAAAVAVGCSGYIVGLLHSFGIDLPPYLASGWFASSSGGVNVIAITVIAMVTGILIVGTRASAAVTSALVTIKLAALLAFTFITVPAIRWHNFFPFMPFGFGSTEVNGTVKGVMAGASLIFFAYLGFDTVSTAAEETRNPNRNVPLGLMGSLAVCTLLYALVAAGTVGTTPYSQLAGNTEPLAWVLRNLGHPMLGNLIGLAAVVALPSVLLMLLFGQTRIFFAMSRDGLLPTYFSRVHRRFHTPHIVTAITGAAVALVAGLFSVQEIAELSNTGTLFAFIAVSVAVLVLRINEPLRQRPFRCPAVWFVAPVAVGGCAYLFISLSVATQLRFLGWSVIGIAAYFLYGYRRSSLRAIR